MTAGQYKYELGCLRSGVIAQIRKMLKDRGHNDIDFKTPLSYSYPEGQDGEHEVIGGFVLDPIGSAPDGVVTHFYGDIQNDDLTTDDMTTDQLVWILEQVETEAYELAENV